MAKAQYTLVASGSATTPRLDIDVWCMDDESAKQQATAMAKALAQSNYFNFSLYATPDSGEHKIVGSVRVEITVTAAFVNAGERG